METYTAEIHFVKMWFIKTPSPSCEVHLFTHFSYLNEYIATANDVHKNTQVQFCI
jgi:hypothetical protein